MSVKELGRLKGLIPATFTPLNADGEVNLKIISDYVQYLADNGIEYIFVNGTTGEGPSFTVEERKTLAEVWLKASKEVLKGVMVHVGGGNAVSCQLIVDDPTLKSVTQQRLKNIAMSDMALKLVRFWS